MKNKTQTFNSVVSILEKHKLQHKPLMSTDIKGLYTSYAYGRQFEDRSKAYSELQELEKSVTGLYVVLHNNIIDIEITTK